MKKLFILFYLLFLSVNVFAVDYNAEKFKDIEKMANKLVKDRINDLKKFNVKKVIIVEYTGEFLQSKATEHLPSAPPKWQHPAAGNCFIRSIRAQAA